MRPSRVACWLLLASLWIATAAAARPLSVRLSRLRDERWDADGQLAGVTAITQTLDGYLWVGSQTGLFRFDGVRFVRADGLPNPYVRALFTARDGALYIGTQGGLALRRGDHVEARPELRDLLVQVLFEDAASTIWVGTFDGLFRSRAADGGRFEKVAALGERSIAALAEPRPGQLLVGTAGGGLKELVGDRITRQWDAPGDAHWAVRCIGRLDDESWLVGTDGETLVWREGELHAYPYALAPHAICDDAVRDEDGTLWWATARAGIFRYAAGRVTVDAEPWTQSMVESLFRDAEGDLWVGTVNDGLHRLRQGPLLPLGRPEGLPGDVIETVTALDDGSLWVGFAGAGAARVGAADPTEMPSVERLTRDSAPITESVASVATTPDGSIWFGTEDGLLSRGPDKRLGPRLLTGRFITALLPVGDKLLVGTTNGLVEVEHGVARPRPEVSPVTVDALARTADGNVWVAAAGLGLYQLGPTSTKLWRREDGLRSVRISSLWADGDALWIGSYGNGGGGLTRISQGRLHWFDPASGAPQESLTALSGDGRGGLWACAGRGLVAMSLADLGEAARDPRHRVRADRYGDRDGMRNATCTRTSARDRAGRLYFATPRGLVEVDPARESPTRRPPRVYIEELALDGKTRAAAPEVELNPGGHRLQIRYSAPLYAEPERLQLRYRLQGIDRDWQTSGPDRLATYTDLPPGRFEFVVQALVAGEVRGASASMRLRVPTRYYQTIWFRLLVALAALTSLFSVFQLRIRLLERQRAALTAEVAARTEDLRAKNAALVAAMAALKEAQEERLRTERLASVAVLVRGIAHELNNPLGVISGNVGVLRRYAGFLSDAAGKLAARFAGTSAELAETTRFGARRDLRYVQEELVRVITDVEESARRAELIVGDLQRVDGGGPRLAEEVDVAAAARSAVRIFARRLPARASLTTEVPERLSMSARAGELEQLLINLVDNALRAIGEGGRIVVSARTLDDGVELAVRDDGAGMLEEVRKRATQAFYTTRAPGEGSGLGLAVVSAIVGHHAGNMSIESAPGRGTTVRVVLHPIGPAQEPPA